MTATAAVTVVVTPSEPLPNAAATAALERPSPRDGSRCQRPRSNEDTTRAARKEAQPGGSAAAPAVSPPDLADSASLVSAAWSDPAAYEGTTVFGQQEMPTVFAASITLHELVLHGWDLARATGRPFAVSDEAARIALGVVEQIADQARGNGAYGPPVPVPADASAVQRALGTSGRNPGWDG